jgi:hypothetical protein
VSQHKTLKDYCIDASEAAAQAHLYRAHPGARYYSDQASFAARCAMRAKTVQQAKRYAEKAREHATRAKLMAPERANDLQHLFDSVYISRQATAALKEAGQSWSGFLALHITSGRPSSRWTLVTDEVLELTSQVGITVISLVHEAEEAV